VGRFARTINALKTDPNAFVHGSILPSKGPLFTRIFSTKPLQHEKTLYSSLLPFAKGCVNT
jgi:hypothetical protein